MSTYSQTLYKVNKNKKWQWWNKLRSIPGISHRERHRYQMNWLETVKVIKRLCRHTASLKPHALKNTLTLNEARHLILTLSRPIAEISSLIQTNIDVVQEKEEKVQKSFEQWNQLNEELYIPLIDLEIIPLGYVTLAVSINGSLFVCQQNKRKQSAMSLVDFTNELVTWRK